VKARRRLLDYYRQFQELSAEEVSREYAEQSAAARSEALGVIPALDLTSTAWHEPPHAEIVNAATYALRRAVNAYPDPSAAAAREALAARHRLDPGQVVVGHGAGELLGAAVAALLGTGGEVVLPWPTWPPLPALVARAGGTPVAVALHEAAVDLSAIDAAVRTETRAVVLPSPNDPTGLALDPAELSSFLRALPERVVVVLDEACADFLPDDATGLSKVRESPRLVVVRSFAKAHAMAGFRVGWAAGGEGTSELLSAMTPSGAVGAAGQAAAAAAVEVADRVLPARRAAAAADRARLARALDGTGVSFPAGAVANFVWLGGERLEPGALVSRLAAGQVFVTPGGVYGDARRVRAALRGPMAVDRLAGLLLGLRAARQRGGQGQPPLVRGG
jgi:histidinol-phosphate/aromatic aminotransferase/cobyric acid decarboxylase-like protein